METVCVREWYARAREGISKRGGDAQVEEKPEGADNRNRR
jgi:hypothetical protein